MTQSCQIWHQAKIKESSYYSVTYSFFIYMEKLFRHPDATSHQLNRIEPGLNSLFHGLAFHTFTGDHLTKEQQEHNASHDNAVLRGIALIKAISRDFELSQLVDPTSLVYSRANSLLSQQVDKIERTDSRLLKSERDHGNKDNTHQELLQDIFKALST